MVSGAESHPLSAFDIATVLIRGGQFSLLLLATSFSASIISHAINVRIVSQQPSNKFSRHAYPRLALP